VLKPNSNAALKIMQAQLFRFIVLFSSSLPSLADSAATRKFAGSFLIAAGYRAALYSGSSPPRT
jgi:hypothetical protein